MAFIIFLLKEVFVICLFLTALLAPQAQALNIKRAAAPEPQLLVPAIPGDYFPPTATTTAAPQQRAHILLSRIRPRRCWWHEGCNVPSAILPINYNRPWVAPNTEGATPKPTQTETHTLDERAPERGMYSILPVDIQSATAPGMYPILTVATNEEAASQPTPSKTTTPSRVLKQTLRAGPEDNYVQPPKTLVTRAAKPTKQLVTRAAEPNPTAKTLVPRDDPTEPNKHLEWKVNPVYHPPDRSWDSQGALQKFALILYQMFDVSEKWPFGKWGAWSEGT